MSTASHRPRLSWCLLALLVLLPAPTPATAAVRLHPTFSDHAVLQQGMRVPVWGTADEGESVTVEFEGQRHRTVARQGRWMIELSRLRASNQGAVLKATGPANEAVIRDVVVGEVWVCSGQSNMEWPLRASFQPEADIAASTNPNLRLFTVTKRRSPTLLADLDYASHAWDTASPESVRNFSAVGYYFGRTLEAALKDGDVPVGIIHTSWGGSPAEVWIREDVLKSDREYAADIVAAAVEPRARWEKAVRAWEERKNAASATGEAFTENRPGQPWQPSELYNGMLANIIPYAIQGAIWYQGESNAGRAWQYRRLFADMIRNWRQAWGQGNFTFLAVQLAPWDRNRKRDIGVIAAEIGESDWAELREAQNHVATVLPRVDVAVITDVGDKDDIHPKKKLPVGERLARLALAGVYGDKIPSHGPRFRSMKMKGNEAVLQFRDVGQSLRTLDGQGVTGFTVAGADRKFHAATARITGADQITVTADDVPVPVAVRFGWNDYPVVNLANTAFLPASPFRTDEWPVSTQPR